MEEKNGVIADLRNKVSDLKRELKEIKVKQQLERDRRRASVVLGLPGAQYDNEGMGAGGRRQSRTALSRTNSMRRMSRMGAAGYVFGFARCGL